MRLIPGFYGKLPVFEDYVTSDGLSNSTTEFRDWLNRSFDNLTSVLADNFGARFKSMPTLAMAVKLPNAPQAVVGLWMPSRDTSGRESPFTVFAEVKEAVYAEQFCLVPEVYRLFLQIGQKGLADAEKAFAPNHQRDTLWALGEGLRADYTGARMQYTTHLGTTTLKQFLQAVAPDQTLESGLKILKNIIIGLTPTRDAIPDNFRAILRYPLSGNMEKAGLEMAVWMQLTESLLGIHLTNQAIFWTGERFDIAFSQCDERLLAWVLTIDENDDNLWDFSAMNLDGSMMDESLFGKFEAALANENQSLADMYSSTQEVIAGT